MSRKEPPDPTFPGLQLGARRTATSHSSASDQRIARDLDAGVRLHQAGALDQASVVYRRILDEHPDHPDALHLLALVIHTRGDGDTAIQLIERAIARHQNFPEAHNNLGNILKAKGELDAAMRHYRQAIQLDPRYAKAHYNLGNLYQDQNRLDDAVTCYRRAIASDHGFAQAHCELGSALSEQGKMDAAINHFRRALDLNPRYAEAARNLGVLLQSKGRFEEAVQQFELAIEARPSYVLPYSNLAMIRKFKPGDPLVSRIEGLLAEQKPSSPDRAVLHFTLGKCLDDMGDYEKAFEHYRAANGIKNLEGPFDIAAHKKRTKRLMAVFTRALLAERASWGNLSGKPIFIVGMPRSGTTLVEQILASHPDVIGAGELRDIHNLARSLSGRLDTTTPYPDCVAEMDVESLRETAQLYLDRLDTLGGKARCVVDKAPANFRHLGFIALLFPRARIIHCRRNALDVCLSCYFQDFPFQPFSHDLETIGVYYREYERLMAHWRRAVSIPMLDVHYEDIVADTEASSRRIIEFCDLIWDDSCLTFYKADRSVVTSSLWQVRQPIYKSSIERWRRYEGHLDPLKRALKHAL